MGFGRIVVVAPVEHLACTEHAVVLAADRFDEGDFAVWLVPVGFIFVDAGGGRPAAGEHGHAAGIAIGGRTVGVLKYGAFLGQAIDPGGDDRLPGVEAVHPGVEIVYTNDEQVWWLPVADPAACCDRGSRADH